MKYCENCGVRIPQSAKFCSKCLKLFITVRIKIPEKLDKKFERAYKLGIDFLQKKKFCAAIKQFKLLINTNYQKVRI